MYGLLQERSSAELRELQNQNQSNRSSQVSEIYWRRIGGKRSIMESTLWLILLGSISLGWPLREHILHF